MTARPGKWARIMVGGYGLTTDTTNIAFDGPTYAEVEASGYSEDESFVLGQGTSSITLDGMLSVNAAAALDTPSEDEIVSVALGNKALPAVGDPTWCLAGCQPNYTAGSDKAALQTVNVTYRPKKGGDHIIEIGKLLMDSTITANTDGASVDNAASSSNGGAGYAHVTGLSAGDTIATLKIQDSADDAIWADLITFTLDGSALAAERLTVSGTVDRYVRAIATVTGSGISFPVFVTFIRS